MQTQSHFLLTWFLADRFRDRLQPHTPALVVGSVAPDLPLFILTAWFFAVPRRGAGETGEVFGELYDAYFFEEPLWIVAHNGLHAPVVLLALMAVGLWLERGGSGWGTGLWYPGGWDTPPPRTRETAPGMRTYCTVITAALSNAARDTVLVSRLFAVNQISELRSRISRVVELA